MRLENALADFLVIHLEQLIERRRIETGDEEFGMAALHIGDGALDRVRGGPQKENAVLFAFGEFNELWNDIGTGDPLTQSIAEQPGSPD